MSSIGLSHKSRFHISSAARTSRFSSTIPSGTLRKELPRWLEMDAISLGCTIPTDAPDSVTNFLLNDFSFLC